MISQDSSNELSKEKQLMDKRDETELIKSWILLIDNYLKDQWKDSMYITYYAKQWMDNKYIPAKEIIHQMSKASTQMMQNSIDLSKSLSTSMLLLSSPRSSLNKTMIKNINEDEKKRIDPFASSVSLASYAYTYDYHHSSSNNNNNNNSCEHCFFCQTALPLQKNIPFHHSSSPSSSSTIIKKHHPSTRLSQISTMTLKRLNHLFKDQGKEIEVELSYQLQHDQFLSSLASLPSLSTHSIHSFTLPPIEVTSSPSIIINDEDDKRCSIHHHHRNNNKQQYNYLFNIKQSISTYFYHHHKIKFKRPTVSLSKKKKSLKAKA
ncbi:unnamed protein product [Cunninghamella blakesleeana]